LNRWAVKLAGGGDQRTGRMAVAWRQPRGSGGHALGRSWRSAKPPV